MSFVQTTGLKNQVNFQKVDVTRLSGYSNFQTPDHLENIIDQQLRYLVKKHDFSSVNDLINKYGDAVYEVIQQYCKNPNTKTAFQNVINKYREQEENAQAQICFDPLITSEIAYVDKESLGASGQKAVRVSSIKSLA